MNDQIQALAIKKAKKSPCNYKVSAIALNAKGEVIASAHNTSRFDKFAGSNHAEMMVLKKAGSGVRTILLCRVTKTGLLRSIDCCTRCQKVLDKLGIKVHTIGSNDVKVQS